MQRKFLSMRTLPQQLPSRSGTASTPCRPILAIGVLTIAAAAVILWAGAARSQGCGLCDISGSIERSEIARTIRELSGTDYVDVGGEIVRISTRSTLLPEKDLARRYLLDRVAEAGYEPREQWFLLNVYKPDVLTAAVSVTGDSLWAGTTAGEIYLLTAGGGWHDATVISTLDILIFDLELDHYGTLWASGRTIGANFGELHYSDDGGSTWQAMVVGNSFNNIYNLTSIVFMSPTEAMISGSLGTVLAMYYYGTEWMPPLKFDSSKFYNRQLYGSTASGPQHVWITSIAGDIFESDDFGNTWTPHFLTSVTLRDVDFYGPSRGIAVGATEVHYTSDGGETWSMTSVDAYLYTVSMIDTLTAIAAGQDGALMYTADGGATWEDIRQECPRDLDVWKTVLTPDGGAWAAGLHEALRLDDLGPDPVCESYSLTDSVMGSNIIFSKEGLVDPENRIVLCAHYDSRNWEDPYCAPGADDDASGCAGVLETARVFSGASFEKSVDFVLFDGEETGLVGSRAYVADLGGGQTIDAVVCLDMIGKDYSDGNGGIRLEISGRVGEPDSSLKEMVSETAGFLQLDLDCNILAPVESPTSDHKAFWSVEGVPAILLIEGGYRINPHYHDCTDVAQFIDYDFATNVVRAAAGTAARLAGLMSADSLPSTVVLHQNYPNPMFGLTRIRFELPSRMPVDLTLFDSSGRKVAALIKDTIGPGGYQYDWDGTNARGVEVASGVYFLRLKAGGMERVRKVVVLR